MRALIEEPPPANAETFHGLRFQRIDTDQHVHVKAWRPKGTKPYAYFAFRLPINREAWIENEKNKHVRREEAKRARRERSNADALAMREKMEPGIVLVSSWGYDQTNVDFYQVVERRGSMVTLREIASATVPGSEGFMCDSVTPRPNVFIGEPFRKRVTEYGVRLDCCHASPTDVTKRWGRSWYA